MPSSRSPAVRNRLLLALPEPSLDRLLPLLEYVDLPVRTVVVEAGVATDFVHFLNGGLASIVATSATDNEEIEVGHIGREGVSGFHVLLGALKTQQRTFMQIGGSGFRLAVPMLLEACENDPALRGLLLRYIHTYETQLAHSALANARYPILARLARWLLMSHDRIEGDDLPLTHEFLSLMLGVRRSGVTNEIHILEGRHLIRATRGRVHILDREGLETLAGGCYGLPEREYAELIEGREFTHVESSMTYR